jgi:hypothetical protein
MVAGQGASLGGAVLSMAVKGDSLLAGTYSGVSLSTGSGTQWTYIGLSTSVSALAVNGDWIFAGTDKGLFRSIKNSKDWDLLNSDWATSSVSSIVNSGTSLIASNSSGQIYRSIDNGEHWTKIPVSHGMTTIHVSGKVLYGGGYGGLFRSLDDGITWTPMGLSYPITRILALNDANIFAISDGGPLYHSTDTGASWTFLNTGSVAGVVFRALAASGGSIFASTGNGFMRSNDNGKTWTIDNAGIGSVYLYVFAIKGTTLFVGGSDGGRYPIGYVYYRPLSEITAVENSHTLAPARCLLQQNYPNPFNPSTEIAFSIPSSSFVTLKIFDAMGRRVATIVSEELSAGIYRRQWNASGCPSGVYFYRLQTDTFSETKRLLLLR